jgi:hypothetical protein
MPGFFKLTRLEIVLTVALTCSAADPTKGKTGASAETSGH